MKHKPLPACLSKEQRDYLWASVSMVNSADCWLFQGPLSDSGYPRVWIKDVEYVGTRIAYLDFYGEQPGEMQVCHSCDTPTCMNPRHFFLGTHDDNMADRQIKGRQYRGARHHLAKLSEDQVREILDLEGTKSSSEIGQLYGVSKSTIKAIFQGRNWASFTGRTK